LSALALFCSPSLALYPKKLSDSYHPAPTLVLLFKSSVMSTKKAAAAAKAKVLNEASKNAAVDNAKAKVLNQASKNAAVDNAKAKVLNEASKNTVAAPPADNAIPNDGTGVLMLDPWLEPFQDALRSRYSKAQEWIQTINKHEGGLDAFSKVCVYSQLEGLELIPRRVMRSMESMSTRTEISHTESGRRMPSRHTSLETSVSLLLFTVVHRADMSRQLGPSLPPHDQELIRSF
jgi:hypothetical protein